jgi:integrase/recombinase XerD
MTDNAKSEVIIKLVGKLTLEFPDMDQLKVRMIIEEVMYKYEVTSTETALVASDIEQRIQIYIACKRLDGLSEQTLKNYIQDLNIFASYIRKPIATVSTMDLRMYLATRCKNLKPSSTNTQMSILKSFFGWLHTEEYIPKDPSKKLKPTKEPKRLRHALTDEEIENLRQVCRTDREKSLLEFLVSTGCRLSEVTGINIDSINFYEMSLNVVGKGNKERKVFFNIKAKILLKKYLKSRKGNSEALFVSEKAPFARLGNRAVESAIHKIALRANFNKAVFPHIFRHSYATHNLNAGMPLPILQKLMGHSNADTTMIYAEMSEENIMHEYKRIS